MNEAPAAADRETGTRVYRGPDVETLLPRIRAELGPDALITCQRTGLVGGVAGFFQRPCVEIEARPGRVSALGIDGILAGDGDAIVVEPPTDPFAGLLAELAAEAAARNPEPVAKPEPEPEPWPQAESAPWPGPDAEPWAELEAQLVAEEAPEPEPQTLPASALLVQLPRDAARARTTEPPPSPVTAGSDHASEERSATEAQERSADACADPALATSALPAAATIEQTLKDHGLDQALAAEIVAKAAAHGVPFASPRRLKTLVRGTLARAIPIAQAPSAPGRAVAFVGPGGVGKTLCAERFAAAYEAAGHPAVARVALCAGRDAKARVAAAATGSIVAVDTPGTTVRDADAVAALRRELRAAGVTDVHLVLPATMGLAAAEELLAAHAPLRPAALVLSHADATTQLGALVTLAVRHGLPISFLSHDPAEAAGLVPADPAELAGALLP